MAENEDEAFEEKLLQISNVIDNHSSLLSELLYGCSDIIPGGVAENISNTQELFKELKKREKLSKNETDFLVNLLRSIGFEKIANDLQEFSARVTLDEKTLNKIEQLRKKGRVKFKEGNLEAARDFYKNAIDCISPQKANSDAIKKRRNLTLKWIRCLVGLGTEASLQEAHSACIKLLEYEPDDMKAKVLLSKCLVGLEKYHDALKEIRRLLKVQPKNPEILILHKKVCQQLQLEIENVPSHTSTIQASNIGSDYPRKILFVCDKWSGWYHSLYLMNRQLCMTMAMNQELQVACLVLDAKEQDRRNASKAGILMTTAANRPGIPANDRRLLLMHDNFPFDAPDIVIGHALVTGPEAAELARRFKCRCMQILYDNPVGNIYDEANHELEKQTELGREADFTAAIGPVLSQEWRNRLNRDVIELIPGIPIGIEGNSIPTPSNRCLVIDNVSTKDGHETGLDLTKKALNDCKKRRRPTAVIVQGSFRSSKNELKKNLETILDWSLYNVQITARDASLDVVVGEISSVSLMMMPDSSEMFGMRALEAISAGVPVLINTTFGLAEVIIKYFDEKFWKFLCASEDEDDYETWSERLDSIFDNRTQYFCLAKEFKNAWQKCFPWDVLVNRLLKRFADSGHFIAPSLPSASQNPTPAPSQCYEEALHFVREELKLHEKRQKHILITLITSPTGCEEVSPIGHLSKVPWISVFDFDVNSSKNGLLNRCEKSGNQMGMKICRILCPDDAEERKRKVNIPKGVPWVLLEGTQGNNRNMKEGLEWLTNVITALDSYHHAPITILVLWNPCQQEKSLFKKLQKLLFIFESSSIKGKVKLKIVSQNTSIFEDVEEDWEVTVHSYSLSDLCNAFNDVATESLSKYNHLEFALPVASPDGGIEMQSLPYELRWVNAEMEVLYQSIGDTPEHGQEDASHFYRGGTISWYAINSGYAIERQTWKPIKDKIDELLPTAGTICLNLPHERGAGGTTSARKILFDYHKNYPCVHLSSINQSETVPAIKAIAEFCKLPVIALVDCKHLQGQEFDFKMLINNLSNSRVPCIILEITHHHGSEGRGINLKAAECLNENEADEFVETYSGLRESKTSFLQRLRKDKTKKLQIPFYYALVTFEDQFTALDPFVDDCISGSDKNQRQVLIFLAMAHHYGFTTIPEIILINYLNAPSEATLEDVLTKDSMQLLIEEEGEWRPRHDLIGNKMLEKLLNFNDSPSRPRVHNDYWTFKIALQAEIFITHMPEKLVSHLLTTRVTTDEKSTFSTLINDIPDDDDAIKVFEKAIDVFPDNLFFRVHLGRFYSIKKKAAGFEMAVKYTNQGIDIAKNEESKVVRGQFAQMRGVVCSRQVKYLIDEDGSELKHIIHHATEGCKWFRNAVSICPDMVDGYIPEVRMMCLLFEHIDRITDGGVHSYLRSQDCHPFIIDGISKTLDTLECVPDNDNYTYWKMRTIHLGLRNKTRRPLEDTLEVLKTLRSSQTASRGLINRHIVSTMMEICRSQRKSFTSIANEIMPLLNEALDCDKDGLDRTMSTWVRVAPYDPKVTIQDAENRIFKWCSVTKSLRSYLYQYIIAFINVLDKSDRKYDKILKDTYQDLNTTIKSISRKDVGIVQYPDNAVVWLGKKSNQLDQLVYQNLPESIIVHTKRVKKVLPDAHTTNLRRLNGTITRTHPKLGRISIGRSLNFSFRTDLCDPPLTSANYANKNVEFLVAFNFFGVDVYNVKVIDD